MGLYGGGGGIIGCFLLFLVTRARDVGRGWGLISGSLGKEICRSNVGFKVSLGKKCSETRN